MISVCHALSDKNIGGAGVLLEMLLRHHDPRALSPQVLLPRGAAMTARLSALGIPYTELDGVDATPFSFSSLIAHIRLLRRIRPQLLVAHAAPTARLAARLCSIPVLGVRHCEPSHPPSHLYRRLYRWSTALTVATSNACGARLEEMGLRPVRVIENGYEPVAPPTKEQRRAARAHFGIEEDEIAVGLVGRLAPVKNHAQAIRALKAAEDAEHLSLHFLGEGECRSSLEDLVRSLGLEGRVRFHGFHPSPALFYRAMDAHLSCSLASETSSLALAEGMSAGCVTLATQIAGNRARVGHGGLFFPPGDDGALAGLLRLLTSEDHRKGLSAAARRRAEALPTAAEMTAKYEALFLSLADGRVLPK